MKILTSDAKLICKHRTGRASISPLQVSQDFVTIEGRPVLRQSSPLQSDPMFSVISGCSNAGPTIKPCTLTLLPYQGHSSLVFIEGCPVCLDTIAGLTDGTPPGMVEYSVLDPGQSFVSEE